MLDKKYFVKIRQQLLAYAEQRREMIKLSGDAQHLAKRAIFALQRDNTKEGEEGLAKAKEILLALNKKFAKVDKIFNEGSYKASLEEYVEAYIFNQFLQGKPIGKIAGIEVEENIYIGGLADVPGELVRYAIKSATERKFDIVKKCYQSAEEIVGVLIDMDLTGYNRQKFDQAKQALSKLQQVVYEVSMKKN
jgi:predicted translin family RNA/ssDNA-binding protein